MKTSQLAGFALMVLVSMTFPRLAFAGIAMDCEGTIQSWVLGGYYKRGDCHCSGGQPVCAGASGSSSGGHGGGLSTENAIKLQLFQGVLDGVVNSMFATPPEKQMKPLPPIDNTSGTSGSDAAEKVRQKQFDDNKVDLLSDLKGMDVNPDGTAETLRAGSGKPFDSASDFKLPVLSVAESATPFFGDSMPAEDIQLLVNPENDPRVVDLRKAETYLVDSIKADSLKQAAALQKYEEKEKGETVVHPPACTDLARKLNGYINQRQRFRKTVDLSLEQLNTWETTNRNALMTAAKDGLEFFAGQLLEGLTKRGEAAERLQRIYSNNAGKMAQQGLDITEIEAKIKRLRIMSSAGKVSELRSNFIDWQAFIKDGASGLLVQLTSSNQDIKSMLDDPRMQEYFESEAPALKALLDISRIAASNKVFGKWVAKKVPIIAGVELSIKQSYNALDWMLSFKRITEANSINWKVLDSARSLQTKIDDTYMALKACP